MMVGLAAFLAGAITGGFGLIAWQGPTPAAPKPADPPTVVAAAPEIVVPVVVVAAATPQAAAPVAEVTALRPVFPPVEPRPVVEPLAGLPANPFRPAAPLVIRVDNPNGETTMVVEPGRTRTVRGKVRVLKVPGLEAGASLDCSDLDADEVVVSGKIDGASKLWVKALGGRVTFLARIDGKSRIEVRAPGGLVSFAPEAGPRVEGGRVEGGAAVEVLAKAVTLHSPVRGGGTRVSAVLTGGGSLTFAAVDGPARLEYRRADPEEPHPAVNPGRVGAGAAVVRLPDPEDD